MNLDCVLISQNLISKQLCISIIYKHFLCLYDKISNGFNAKNSLNAVSTSPLEGNVVWHKKASRGLKTGCFKIDATY